MVMVIGHERLPAPMNAKVDVSYRLIAQHNKYFDRLVDLLYDLPFMAVIRANPQDGQLPTHE
jgi:hypothetical protein